ncbi:putative transcription factor C2C2-GATA family [Rosa chinensis]|uniref:GATA transcription factor n=1 Tax=Rosa chinensis TaxID=74649 RepID=A0A2P6RXA4_ROSCH|nr:GATA transcription factor 9 [Rosa chinensis]PRQ51057.1 putative transcription factor C2C2-GATA family [Rosa chinensis]
MELPEFYVGGYFDGQLSTEKRQLADQKPAGGEQFTIDDLLDFSNEDALVTDGFFDSTVAGNSTDSSTVTAVDSCNSSVSGGEPQLSGNRSFGDSQFSGDLCVPYDDLAELEWLSNFVEDSFSVDKDLQALQILSTTTAKPQTPETSSSSAETPQNPPLFHHETPLPGKARSKRSRAAPGDWTTRLLHLITPNNSSEPKPAPKTTTSSQKKREGGNCNSGSDSSGRKCLHCASEKTPQWRTGPMGPKTLCNACGVRYKSGRLVPEYRPAASPTFVSARHSNSHRKVLELRRQKEFQRSHQHQFLSPSSIFGVSNGGGDEFLIHHRGANDFRQMM